MTRPDCLPAPASDLSIVVAVWPDDRGLSEFLAALTPQLDERTEVLVVGSCGATVQTRSQVRGLAADGLIPDLWAAGLHEARGEVIAITTAHFQPGSAWVAGIRAAHARLDSAGIGGPIAPPRGHGPVFWATYFLRYSAYFAYDREKDVPDIAGDNASYKRSALAEHPECVRGGFWELDFHRRLLAAGGRLTFVPEVGVAQAQSFGFFGFLAQRFEHGRQFGGARWAARSLAIRLAAAAAAPLVPAIFLGKIVRRVLRSRRDYGPFLAALPMLLCFLAAWSIGEGFGSLRPRPENARLTPHNPAP
jgi:hypothetical protein